MDISDIQKQLSESAQHEQAEALPPVLDWTPDYCGEMNLVIKRNGQWWHEGTPFSRAKLVKLLSSVLRKEGERYFLVTPVEKVGIQVEDVPFVVTDSNSVDDNIQIQTQTGDTVILSQEHPVELREFQGDYLPYCHIRHDLWARVHQNVLYRWVNQATERVFKDHTEWALKSGDYNFVIGRG